jgi:hypothetical protein
VRDSAHKQERSEQPPSRCSRATRGVLGWFHRRSAIHASREPPGRPAGWCSLGTTLVGSDTGRPEHRRRGSHRVELGLRLAREETGELRRPETPRLRVAVDGAPQTLQQGGRPVLELFTVALLEPGDGPAHPRVGRHEGVESSSQVCRQLRAIGWYSRGSRAHARSMTSSISAEWSRSASAWCRMQRNARSGNAVASCSRATDSIVGWLDSSTLR